MSERKRASFVVRMWSEPSSSVEGRWRGSVDDMATNHRMYFSNLGTMCEFMLERRASVSAVDPPDDRGGDEAAG